MSAASEPAGPVRRVPLFPLSTVLVPGLLLPLNLFEPRYLAMIADLQALPAEADRSFGVVAIRHGRETGADSVESLYDVGTLATLRSVDEQDDGRVEILTVGTERFRLRGLDHRHAYLSGDVELIGDPVGDESAAGAAAPVVLAAYREYLVELGRSRDTEIAVPDVPADPPLISWLVAATVVVDLGVRQALLAEPDTASRLAAEESLLRRETRLLKAMSAAPAPDLTRVFQSPN